MPGYVVKYERFLRILLFYKKDTIGSKIKLSASLSLPSPMGDPSHRKRWALEGLSAVPGKGKRGPGRRKRSVPHRSLDG